MAGIHDIARASGTTDEVVAKLFETIVTFAKTEKVMIKGIGTFQIKHQEAREIKSPQIPGGVAQVEARDVLRFKPSPQLKAAMNGGAVAKGTPKAPAAKPAAAKPATAAAKPAAVAPKAAPKVVAKKAPPPPAEEPAAEEPAEEAAAEE